MLLDGVNHVAILTNDTERLHAFYREVFDAKVSRDFDAGPGARLSFIDVGPHTELNVFQVDGNDEATKQTPMMGRAASTTSASTPRRSRRSTRSAIG